MLCKVKKILVAGCSFTANPHPVPITWGNILANRCGIEIINLGIPGAGNTHIANSVQLYLEKNKIDHNDVFIIIMWTGIERIDWITDRTKSQGNEYPFPYYYDEYNELTVGGAWWGAGNKSHLDKTLRTYSKYQSNESLALNSWLAMNSLSSYLKLNKYSYVYTSFFNYFRDSEIPEHWWINYRTELNKLNLTLDQQEWLPLADEEYLGDYVTQHNLLDNDGFHPSVSGHELWLENILIPNIKENIWQTT
jgi:hypothetical protein